MECIESKIKNEISAEKHITDKHDEIIVLSHGLADSGGTIYKFNEHYLINNENFLIEHDEFGDKFSFIYIVDEIYKKMELYLVSPVTGMIYEKRYIEMLRNSAVERSQNNKNKIMKLDLKK